MFAHRLISLKNCAKVFIESQRNRILMKINRNIDIFLIRKKIVLSGFY